MPESPTIVTVDLRWSDLDALRHVNNVQFLRLLEEARIKAFHDWLGPVRRSNGLLVAHAEIDYLDQLHFRGQAVAVHIWVSRVAGASFDTSYELYDSPESDANLCARALTTQVAFDMTDQKPVRIPDDLREVLSAHSGPPVAMKRRGA